MGAAGEHLQWKFKHRTIRGGGIATRSRRSAFERRNATGTGSSSGSDSTFAEAERLVEAAWSRFEAERVYCGVQTQKGYHKRIRDRQVLYWFALTTGFRANECASIRWEDVSLKDRRPCVRLAGDFTKNGDDARIPLQSFVADALRAMRTQLRRRLGPVQGTDQVFRMPDKPAELVRKDAAFAGLIPLKSPTSKRVDFHALRKSCARILIEMQVYPKVTQQALRQLRREASSAPEAS